MLEVWYLDGGALMAEVTCSGCGGDGQTRYPRASYDGHGNPTIEQVIETCIVCNGNGKVDDGS